ncbi:RNA polymerase sigma factor [Novosphingobium mangrovi (ex Huang et al. 2023)]|uniref:RNA polymerase sigma factor n=1 Tax=Novosphingobium mangrovi (ex Huang et al. 2023) TaxID=2976432 RepID=A0ABT2I1G9_9SPHN|nr:RNA polymerase sigma factor [Novosphingobium mangrovi (ex Huang et al. 2023)]MCT2398457.1 RNA polymerase sigma factor [Novosphingobium mangrovi (ex Huang et al. 2023)]
MSVTDPSSSSGLESALLTYREQLLRFLRARGAGDAAEDILQEVWIRITTSNLGPVASPLAYLHTVANAVMVDRYRSVRQAEKRERDWADVHTGEGEVSSEPSAERQLTATQEAAKVLAMLDSLGPRVAAIFRRHRVDGLPQKAVAAELGVSLSTVEGDLRTAYRALAEWKARADGEER